MTSQVSIIVLKTSCKVIGAETNTISAILSGDASANKVATIPPKLCPISVAFSKLYFS